MKVREIELGDLFLAAKIMRKIDLKGMIKEIGVKVVTNEISDEEKDAILVEKSVDMFMYLVSRVDESETEILSLIGGWCGIKPQEAARLKLHEIQEFGQQFVEVNGKENILNFFEKAAESIQKKY